LHVAFESTALCDLPQMPLCKSAIGCAVALLVLSRAGVVGLADWRAVVVRDLVRGRPVEEAGLRKRERIVVALSGLGAGGSASVASISTVLRRLVFCVIDQVLGNLCLGLSTGLSTKAVDKPMPRCTRSASGGTGAQGHRDTGTQGHRDTGTQGHRDRGTQGQRDRGTEGQSGSGTAAQRHSDRGAHGTPGHMVERGCGTGQAGRREADATGDTPVGRLFRPHGRACLLAQDKPFRRIHSIGSS
jgi:hypothetical protein